jgi:uncharacterized protein YjbI with pentapeptide repeats
MKKLTSESFLEMVAEGEVMHNINAEGLDLSHANLQSADLYLVNLTGANLYEANLSSADLRRANLTKANLTKTNLTSAILYSTNLYKAVLIGADLSCVLTDQGTIFEQANFLRALLPASVYTVTYGRLLIPDFTNAIMPDGVTYQRW